MPDTKPPGTLSERSRHAKIQAEYVAAYRDYKRQKRAYGGNGQRCVVAYELRRRGYDVVARPLLARNDVVVKNWNRLFIDQKFVDVGGEDARTAIANLETEIANYGDDSRSVVFVIWKGGCNRAHVFIVERQHGKAVYVDPQSGKVNYEDWKSKFVPTSLKVSRVDDKAVDTQYLFQAIREAQ